jgi:hypothetical protein
VEAPSSAEKHSLSVKKKFSNEACCSMMAHIFNMLALQLFQINSRTSGLITIAGGILSSLTFKEGFTYRLGRLKLRTSKSNGHPSKVYNIFETVIGLSYIFCHNAQFK